MASGGTFFYIVVYPDAGLWAGTTSDFLRLLYFIFNDCMQLIAWWYGLKCVFSMGMHGQWCSYFSYGLVSD